MAAVPSIGRASLVEAPARAPQAAATAGLYERHSAKILSYCLHQLGSREEAEDAVQTTFMNAFRALGRGVVPESESAWLFKIAENVCLSRRRSSWRRGRIESPSDFDIIEEIVPGPSRQRDELIGIEDALASMPEQQRRAILLREWQGLSYREIADELEVSQSAVETLIFRARRSLANGLEQPDLVKKPKRKSFRRALHMIDIGTIAAAVKTVLAGSAAVKATAAAVAVTAAAGTAAAVKDEGRSPNGAASAPAVVAPVAPKAAAADDRIAALPSASDGSVYVAQAVAATRRSSAEDEASRAKPKALAATRKATPKAPKPAAAAPSSAPVAAAPPEVPAAPVEQTAPPAPEEQHASPPVVVEQPPSQPPAQQPKQEEKRGAKDTHGGGRGKGSSPEAEPTPVVAATPPAAVTIAAAPVPAPVADERPDGNAAKQERRDRKDKRDLAAAPAAAAAPQTTEPANDAHGEAVTAEAAPAAEAAPTESSSDGAKGTRHRRK